MANQSSQSSSTNSPRNELTSNDLALLCNILNPVASKCCDLGLQLGVKQTRIQTIIANNRNDCEAQLREIISERLKNVLPLTWHDIVRALRSPSVNHPDLARHIQSWYKHPDLQQHPSYHPQQHLSLGGERPYHMVMMGLENSSKDTISVRNSITEENPTRDRISVPTCSLCGACFRTIIKPVFSCLLCRRGPPHGENYQPFAQLRGPVDIRTPDSAAWRSPYTCLPHYMRPYQTAPPNTLSITQYYPTAHSQGSSVTHSAQFDTFVHYVKTTYKRCEIEKNLNVLKWPPTPSKIFINLACIDMETTVNKDKADEYTRAMVEDGNIDVIMKEKKNIDFEDIVRDLPPVTALEKVVLVEGAPGVGKSTFAWEFCRRWERGEIAKHYQLVLLLRLRDERMSRAKSLRDLIYHASESVCQTVVGELESTFGVNTLIILEGFDELPDIQRKEPSIFLQLILGQLLPHATIMITSRPWATGKIMRKVEGRIFQHIEVLGFTEKNIVKYVRSVFTGEGKKIASAIDQSVPCSYKVSQEAKTSIDDVMAYIDTFPQIKACMYIPLNAAIVVSIHQESKKGMCILPNTLTELYYALTQILLLRYLYGYTDYKEQEWNIDSFEKDLPDKVYKKLLNICKVAYNGVCTKGRERVQLIFSDHDLGGCETLGFMQSVTEVYVMHGRKMSYNFLHLTVQEFLAAFLISTKSPAEQLAHFRRHNDGRLRVVLRFLAGLTKLNVVTPDQLRSLFGEPTVEEIEKHQTPYCNPMRPDVCVSAHHTNWLFEAQNSELLQSLFQNHTASFTFTRGMLPLEYYSVGYCIAHSHSKWSLTFDEDTEEEKLHMLVSGAKTCCSDYRVALNTTSMTSKNMHILMNSFSSNVEELYPFKIPDNLSLPPLTKLRILELQIDNHEFTFNISCDSTFPSLKALIISSGHECITLGTQTCATIGKLLSSTSLKTFRLSACSTHVSNKDMKIITKSLIDNINLPLRSLDIDCKCTFTTTATRSLVQFITRSATLQYFKIHIDNFEDVDIFAKGLSDNVALLLKGLDIDCKCTFTTTATRSLAEIITRSTTLQYLKLHVDTLRDVDIFAKSFSDNIAIPLQSLDIDCKCTFTTTATRSLVQFITRSTTLQYIRICHVTFSAQKLIEMTETIHHCSRLQEKQLMELSFHVECSEDVVNLRHMIKDHPDMQKSITHWDRVTNVLSSSTEIEYKRNEKMNASAVNLGLGCSHDTSLNLMNMGIGDAGAVALAQALHHNSTLKWLDLSNNVITDAGAVALAQALYYESTLLGLYLSGNDAIGKEGTHQLVQALTVNASITTCGLGLPSKCEEYATQCTQYNTVKNRIKFW